MNIMSGKSAESRCEHYTREQLGVLGWNLRKVSQGGDVAEKQELRNDPALSKLMDRETPEFVLFIDNIPKVTIECKANKKQIDDACKEAQYYADKLELKIAVGVAGNNDDGVIVKNFYKVKSEWEIVTYHKSPLTQILSKKYVERLLAINRSEIEIELPDENRFYAEADHIHNLLRNSHIPKQRMAAYLGTIILAFYENNDLLNNFEFNDLGVINYLAQEKLDDYKKSDLKQIFEIPNPKSQVFQDLKRNLPLIINSLQRLDVLPLLLSGADILGKFFEIFLRYSNDKRELGIVFTPRHIVDFMCRLIDLKYTDKVLDPCCGTGGFLVTAMKTMKERVKTDGKLKLEQKENEFNKINKGRLYGMESEADGIIYGLACLNMIFRGDGNANIKHKNCFQFQYDFKFDKILINPPYSQAKKSTNGAKETDFLDYCLKNLKPDGLLCAIVPYSVFCDADEWRRAVMQSHTIIASISVPAELFYPISAPAIIVLIKAHTPQNNQPIFFARIEDDGFIIDRQKRSQVGKGQQENVLEEFIKWRALYETKMRSRVNRPKFIISKTIPISDNLLEIVPEAHLSSARWTREQIENEVDYILKEQLSFQFKYSNLLIQKGYKPNKKSNPNVFLNKLSLPEKSNGKIKLSDVFEPRNIRGNIVYCEYGQRELHDKSWLQAGLDIIIASGGVENGLYGFYNFPPRYNSAVISCPSSGSICQAFLQEFPCSAYDNTLIFIPKDGIKKELLYYITAFIRLEAWRYRYGRQITPIRLGNLDIDLRYYNYQAIKLYRDNFPFHMEESE